MAETGCQACPSLAIQEWNQTNGWQEHVFTHEESDNPRELISEDTHVYILFAKADTLRNCPSCRQKFTSIFYFPRFWWSQCVSKSKGYFGHQVIRQAGKPAEYNTWVNFEFKRVFQDMSYQWSKVNVFTKWEYSMEKTGILIIDPIDNASKWFPRPAIDSMSDPFWVFTYLVEEIVSRAESAVESIRDQIWPVELSIQPFLPPGKRAYTLRPGPQDWHDAWHDANSRCATFPQLHDISRHAAHVTETLDVSIHILEQILSHHEDYLKLSHITSSGKEQTLQSGEDIHSQLTFLRSCLSSIRHRSTTNEKRIQNEMQEKYSIAIQQIADLARNDSASMKKIAYVTLIFLPPTFVCALFSTSFFNYSLDSGWSVAEEFWIYWATAVPTTLVIIIVWQYCGITVPHSQVKSKPKSVGLKELV